VVVAVLAAGAVVATFAISFATDPGRRADAKVFMRVGRHDAPNLRRLGRRIGGDTLNVAAAGGVVAGAIVLALLSVAGRTRLQGSAIALLLAGGFVTTEILKHVLGDKGRELAPARVPDTFPSGHATLALGIVLAAVMSVPQRHRAIATLVGSAVATVLGLLIVVGNLHPPSDVVGGYLVAAMWAALLSPLVRGTQQAHERKRPTISTALFVLIGLLALMFVVLAGTYVENVLGADRLLFVLVAALAFVSTVIVALVGVLSDWSPPVSAIAQ
jgi:membrane-associated phospholipid phosphatase